MSEAEKTPQDSSELSELRQECADLRRQSNLLFMALTITSLIMTTWLFVQSRRTAKDLEVVVQQESQVRETNKKAKPTLDNFLTRLFIYSQDHPDFAAILNKYPLVRQGATNAVTPSSALPQSPQPANPK